MAPDDRVRADAGNARLDAALGEYRYTRAGLLWVSVPRDREMILIYKPLPPGPDGVVRGCLIEDTLRGDEIENENELRAAVDRWFDGGTSLDYLSLRPASAEMMGPLAPYEATREIPGPAMSPNNRGERPELHEDTTTAGGLQDSAGDRVSYTRDHITFVYDGGHRISRCVDTGIPAGTGEQTEDILIVNRHLTTDEFEAAVDRWLDAGGLRRVGLDTHSPRPLGDRCR